LWVMVSEDKTKATRTVAPTIRGGRTTQISHGAIKGSHKERVMHHKVFKVNKHRISRAE